jgi:hypothetical protein
MTPMAIMLTWPMDKGAVHNDLMPSLDGLRLALGTERTHECQGPPPFYEADLPATMRVLYCSAVALS